MRAVRAPSVASARSLSRASRARLTIVGLVVVFVAWQVIGRAEVFGRAWPPFTTVLEQWFESRSSLLSALAVTTYEAGVGWVFGTLLAFLSGVVAVFVRSIRPGLLHVAVVVNSIPVIALGPVLISIFPRAVAPMALAAISVYFTTLVATTTGFAATKAAHEDLFTALGAGTRERFRRLQLPTALPLIIDGLKLAVPAAVLGAILGEWFGSPEGLGPILVATMQDAVYPLLWATALTGVVLSLLGFGLLALLHQGVKERYG
ncbi:MAG TPA: ABC transporter permease subunit [Actinomycetes bacterium]|jgi:NitT/TauT family transport system permease protein|nr:ABC transporter permease subunit [Actinomycetes bacterium]